MKIRSRAPRGLWSVRGAALSFLLAGSAVTTFAQDARAQDEETQKRAIAQALFNDAQALMDKKQFDQACPKLEEVVRLQAGKIGAVLTLARCYEGAGKTASAWSRYTNAAELARTSKDQRGEEAQKKAAELEKKLPKISITVPAELKGLPGLTVKRDGAEVTSVQWSLALPVDPGVHLVTVSAPGYTSWTGNVQATEGKTLAVELPALVREGASPKPATPAEPAPKGAVTSPAPGAGSSSPGPTPGKPAPPPPGGSRTNDSGAPGSARGTVGLVIAGVGVLGLAAGGVAGGLAVGQHDELAKVCPEGACPVDKQSAVDTYAMTGLISTVSLAAGAALAAGGLVLWLTAPKAPAKAGVMVGPYAGPGTVGVTGRF